MNLALLTRLRDADGEFVPWTSLLDAGPTTSELLRDDLAALESFGYGFEWHPYRGVAYRGGPRRLCADWIEHDLRTSCIGRRIHFWQRTASTNDLAAAAAHSRANNGLVVLAEEQTAGRGRHGRRWTVPAESSLLMSVLLFPPPELSVATAMTTLGAVAAAEVVETFAPGHRAQIKWPNDVRVATRKLAGVLVERRRGAWIVGIGLNVNIPAADFPDDLRPQATSIERLTGAPVDRSDVARALIQALDRFYQQGPPALETSWRSRLEGLGTHVQIRTARRQLQGLWVDARFLQGLAIRAPGDPGLTWIPAEEEAAIATIDNLPI